DCQLERAPRLVAPTRGSAAFEIGRRNQDRRSWALGKGLDHLVVVIRASRSPRQRKAQQRWAAGRRDLAHVQMALPRDFGEGVAQLGTVAVAKDNDPASGGVAE